MFASPPIFFNEPIASDASYASQGEAADKEGAAWHAKCVSGILDTIHSRAIHLKNKKATNHYKWFVKDSGLIVLETFALLEEVQLGDKLKTDATLINKFRKTAAIEFKVQNKKGSVIDKLHKTFKDLAKKPVDIKILAHDGDELSKQIHDIHSECVYDAEQRILAPKMAKILVLNYDELLEWLPRFESNN